MNTSGEGTGNMTEAPERIWATTYHLTSTKGFWYNEPITPNRPENQGVEYVRADLAQPVAVNRKPRLSWQSTLAP